MFKCTLNIGVINRGRKVNMIPSDYSFEAEYRLLVGLEAAEVLDAIAGIL